MKHQITNASDEAQVSAGAKRDKSREQRNKEDLAFVLRSEQGRRFIWTLLDHCKTFSSVWDNSARIHYNSGKQDVGHHVIREIQNADQEAFFKMMKDSKEY